MTHPWYRSWFNDDYLRLYPHRSQQEAESQITFLCEKIPLQLPMRILDLGCGAGRHTLSLASRGFEVVGIDQSETLIDRAEKACSALPNASLIQQDMRDPLPGSFDAILCLFTSFGYFEEDEENRRILQNAYDSLVSGGVFVLDYLHPDEVRRTITPKSTQRLDGQDVLIEKEIIGNVVVKTIHFPSKTYQERVTLYSRHQVEQLLTQCGFEVLDVWNDFQGHAWREEGDRQIFLLVKP